MPFDIATLLPGARYDEIEELVYLANGRLKCNWTLMCTEAATAVRDGAPATRIGPTPTCQRCTRRGQCEGEAVPVQLLTECRHCRQQIHQLTEAGVAWLHGKFPTGGEPSVKPGTWMVARTEDSCPDNKDGHEPVAVDADV